MLHSTELMQFHVLHIFHADRQSDYTEEHFMAWFEENFMKWSLNQIFQQFYA